MKTQHAVIAIAAAALVALGAIYFVEVNQTEEGQLPEVDVSVNNGKMPEYEVETGSVKVGSEKTEVTVPEVEMKEKEVEVPTLEVEPAQ
ncbi:MAG: hypothetical protein JJ891_14625 [Rhizobiaceae bacterium]|nr:hypothetical protein [Rhizobiaceae bacterium]